ncbi:MAG: hypothetical protein RIR48_344, partial [Bacteroidota bacterium]
MLLTFHKTDQQSIRKNALILFVINSFAWSVAIFGKSLHLPKMVLIVFFSIYIILAIAFLVYIYRFLDLKDKRKPLHPDLEGVVPEIRSGIFGIYSMTFLFATLPSNFKNLLEFEISFVIDFMIYAGLVSIMA